MGIKMFGVFGFLWFMSGAVGTALYIVDVIPAGVLSGCFAGIAIMSAVLKAFESFKTLVLEDY